MNWTHCKTVVVTIVVQMMSILVVNQSVLDMCASVFTVLLTVDQKRTGMSGDSIFDQFICRFWLTGVPLWCMLVTANYGILLMALSRYVAVIYPIKYKNVRIIVTLYWKINQTNSSP